MLGSWDDATKLGEYILDQLGRDRRAEDLLVHWVAHALAEKMLLAERSRNARERAEARDAAALLIARLWEARGGWPRGWPPTSMREFVAGIGSSRRRSFEEPPPQRFPPWLSSLDQLDGLHSEERHAWLCAALLEQDGSDLQAALDAAPAGFEDDDLDALRLHVRRREEAEEWFVSRADEQEDVTVRADRARVLQRVLDEISERHARLIEVALRDARRNQWRRPVVAAQRPKRRRERQRRARQSM